MSENIDEIYQIVVLIIAIYITYTFVRWSRIHDDRRVPFASRGYNTQKKGNSPVYNSIDNDQ